MLKTNLLTSQHFFKKQIKIDFISSYPFPNYLFLLFQHHVPFINHSHNQQNNHDIQNAKQKQRHPDV